MVTPRRFEQLREDAQGVIDFYAEAVPVLLALEPQASVLHGFGHPGGGAQGSQNVGLAFLAPPLSSNWVLCLFCRTLKSLSTISVTTPGMAKSSEELGQLAKCLHESSSDTSNPSDPLLPPQ